MVKRWIAFVTVCCCALFGACAPASQPTASPSAAAPTSPAVTQETVTTTKTTVTTEASVVPATTTTQTQAPVTRPSDPSKTASFVKAVWVPFMEVNELLASGDPAVCRQQMNTMLDDCVSRGVNTVYFHVRANSDAYYASQVFKAHARVKPLLDQGFDPLSYAVEGAHARGMTLHAWVNPYRIGADKSFAQTDEVFEFGGKWYYVPTSFGNRKLIVDGIRELVSGYDIDGVQFDDYFYPKGAVNASETASFETADYEAYVHGNGALPVGDWRRAQVSLLIADVYAACHARENCVFGVSPGYDIHDNYQNLYADIKSWVGAVGYVDYICPQLYFGYEHSTAAFDKLLQTWSSLKRASGVEIYAGLGLYKTGLLSDTYAGAGKTEWAQHHDIIARQLADVYAAHWNGAALYSHQSFKADSTRDGTVAAAECEAACAVWKNY